MNSCDFYQELISRLVDGEVSHDEYEALMAHMKSCSRCNAMYAVFHDLSDLIADEAREELPEGLHENIMAGVRRSAIEKKNRRMRSIGLRTALTAAACAVLVLFASLGFAPHERAENVSIRSPQAIETVLPAAPAEAPEPAAQTAPAQPQPKIAATPAVKEEEVPAPAAETAPAERAAVSENAGSTVATGSAESVPDAAADVYLAPAAEAPAAPSANAAQPAEAAAQSAEAAAQPEAPAEAAETESVTLDLSEQAPAPEAAEAAPAEEAAVEEEKHSLFGGLTDLFTSNAYSTESTVTSKDEADTEAAQETPEASESPAPTATPALSANSAPSATPAPTTTPAPSATPAAEKTRSVSLRGREQRAKLLALLGEKEGALPDADITSRIRVTFVPEDEYGTEEKLEIRFYDDFVYFLRKDADGIEKSYCAACSVSELESFLKNADSGASPSPTPTADPFAAAPEDSVNLIVH